MALKISPVWEGIEGRRKRQEVWDTFKILKTVHWWTKHSEKLLFLITWTIQKSKNFEKKNYSKEILKIIYTFHLRISYINLWWQNVKNIYNGDPNTIKSEKQYQKPCRLTSEAIPFSLLLSWPHVLVQVHALWYWSATQILKTAQECTWVPCQLKPENWLQTVIKIFNFCFKTLSRLLKKGEYFLVEIWIKFIN